MTLEDAKRFRDQAFALRGASEELWRAYEDVCAELVRDDPERADRLRRAEERAEAGMGAVRTVLVGWR